MSEGPRESYRKVISLMQIMEMFPNEEAAESWFEGIVWGGSPKCPHCGGTNIASCKDRKPMPYRRRSCRKHFSVRQGTVMAHSRIPLRKWAIAVYMCATNLKSVSSMKLHRDLDIGQRSAWYLMHRIREAFPFDDLPGFSGPVKVDEAYIGGKRKNTGNQKRKASKNTGRGAVGKTAVVGVKDRGTNEVRAEIVEATDKKTLHSFIGENVDKGRIGLYGLCHRLRFAPPSSMNRSSIASASMSRDMAHTNGIESFWALLKRGYRGTFHHFSDKHLDRYVKEFAGRHNLRGFDTRIVMHEITAGMIGKNLSYKELIS